MYKYKCDTSPNGVLALLAIVYYECVYGAKWAWAEIVCLCCMRRLNATLVVLYSLEMPRMRGGETEG